MRWRESGMVFLFIACAGTAPATVGSREGENGSQLPEASASAESEPAAPAPMGTARAESEAVAERYPSTPSTDERGGAETRAGESGAEESSAETSTEESSTPDGIPCETFRDCWIEDGEPVRRPRRLRRRELRPCVDSEVVPGCRDQRCVALYAAC